MTTPFITVDQLRVDAKAGKIEDDPALTRACLVACGMVEDGWSDSRGWHEGVGPVVTTTITNERVQAGVCRYRPATLTTITDWRTGDVLTVADYAIVGQSIVRRDGGRVPPLLQVTYTTGHAATVALAPAWAVQAALILATWVANRRIRPGAGRSEDDSMTALMEAAELLSPHTLAPLGFA